MTDKINGVVSERDSRHGGFDKVSRVSQDLKRVMVSSPNWCHLSDVHKEGLEMVVHKIARVLCGDENYEDNYVDISGYSSVILKYIKK